MTLTSLTREQVVAAEAIERADWRDSFAAVAPDLAAELGMRVEQVGSADVLMTAAADVLMFNRVSGLGIDEPATEEQLDEAIGLYHSAGIPRFFVDVSPAARPIQLSDWVMGRGLAIHNNWVKLTRDVERLVVAPTLARIEEIGIKHAEAFGRIIRSVFELPEPMSRWAASLVGRPRRRHFMAFDHDKPIGTAAMYVDGEWAEFGFAAVIPEARGRNLQSALIAVRIRAARELGCRWLSMETAEETLEKPGYSLRNARRMGFEVAYLRPNYLGKTG